MARRAFTIVELILTMAIIAVLVSLVLPGLARVREQARLTSCSANLRSLLLATFMYTDGPGRGSFPPLRSLVAGEEFGLVLREHAKAISPFVDTPLPAPDNPSRHAPFACPADTKWAPRYGISYFFVPANLTDGAYNQSPSPGSVRSLTLAYENRLPLYDPMWWDFDPTTHRTIAPHGLSGRNLIRYDGGIAWGPRRLADVLDWPESLPPP